MTTHENKSQPLLVTVLASAISSVGYGLSLFAIGLIWLLPSAKPAVPVLVKSRRKPKHHRRRSAPPVLQSNLQRPPLPTFVSTSSKSSTDSPRRRVYFADTPIVQTPPPPTIRRHTSPPEDLHKNSEPLQGIFGPTSIVHVDASPRSSSSTLVHAPLPPTLPSTCIPILDANVKSEAAESEISRPSSSSSSSSSRPSLLVSPRFADKIKAPWIRKPAHTKPIDNLGITDSGVEATQSDESSCSAGPSTPVSKHKRKAASLGFSWPISKNKAAPENAPAFPSSPKTPIDSPLKQDCHPIPSPLSSFVRSSKQQRRVSAPVRARTQPYAYPYFALPPTVAGEPSFVAISPVVGSSDNGSLGSEDTSSVQEPEVTTNQRRPNPAAQASLGHGHPQRRALSEGFALDS
ncbi:hypothetical protein DFJ43DRAFT_1076784 [Lentinula guzmanii]|uniref:Uncharacterized protein n=1 Tax=Lentinula guzmanii TaxID=2804957 RepID=A0AA38J9A6_9AGAR|nr:hypothetical protein DFJ43DRAFT_1076784 [Lentinula guzmanii]